MLVIPYVSIRYNLIPSRNMQGVLVGRVEESLTAACGRAYNICERVKLVM